MEHSKCSLNNAKRLGRLYEPRRQGGRSARHAERPPKKLLWQTNSFRVNVTEGIRVRLVSMSVVRYTVRPHRQAGEAIVIEVPINGEAANESTEDASRPVWTSLAVEQCACCPLTNEETRCPAAVALSGLMEDFGSLLSYDEVDATVETGGRTMKATVPAQKVLSSLLGLVLGTSGCPILAKFMPMARYHLPFASTDETTFRSVGAYLMAQYFVDQDGGEPDWSLVGLKAFYEDVHTINRAMVARLRGHFEGDAGVNAVAILDLFAHYLPMAVDEQLAELRPLFAAFDRPA